MPALEVEVLPTDVYRQKLEPLGKNTIYTNSHAIIVSANGKFAIHELQGESHNGDSRSFKVIDFRSNLTSECVFLFSVQIETEILLTGTVSEL